jgi:hypothetical protein
LAKRCPPINPRINKVTEAMRRMTVISRGRCGFCSGFWRAGVDSAEELVIETADVL